MACKAANIPKMWAKLNETVRLDPVTKMDQNLHLGCKQTHFKPPASAVLDQGIFVKELEGFNLDKIDSSPQGKTPNNSCLDRGALPQGSPPRGGLKVLN